MDLVVEKNLFANKSEVISHANSLGLWPIAQILEEEESEEIHWHSWDTHIYMVAGEFTSIDPETKQKINLRPGDYMVMPKDRLHAMNSIADTVVIYATKKPINFSKPVNLPPEEMVRSGNA
jgi:uncharacterized cupin superfamily protein